MRWQNMYVQYADLSRTKQMEGLKQVLLRAQGGKSCRKIGSVPSVLQKKRNSRNRVKLFQTARKKRKR